MDGVLILLLLLYFLPSLIAGIRSHNNLNSILVLNLLLGWTVLGWIVALVWSLGNGAARAQSMEQPATEQKAEPIINVDRRRSVEHLREVITECQDTCGDATAILITAAQADGKVSRDDLRVIIKFCLKHGANIRKDWPDIVSRLNAGVSLNVTGDRECSESFEALECRPTIYLNTLYGALTALTMSAKRKNSVAERLADRLEHMISDRTNTPEPTTKTPKPVSLNIEDTLPAGGRNQAPSASSWVEQAKAELAAERKR